MNDVHVEWAFQILSLAPGACWMILFFIPTNRLAMKFYDAFLLLLAFHFSWLVIPMVPELFPVIAAPRFDAVFSILTTKIGFLGSWNHMILADLWIGRWIAHDAVERQLNIILRIFFVLTVMFFGPLGLALYSIFRMIRWNEYFLQK